VLTDTRLFYLSLLANYSIIYQSGNNSGSPYRIISTNMEPVPEYNCAHLAVCERLRQPKENSMGHCSSHTYLPKASSAVLIPNESFCALRHIANLKQFLQIPWKQRLRRGWNWLLQVRIARVRKTQFKSYLQWNSETFEACFSCFTARGGRMCPHQRGPQLAFIIMRGRKV